MRNARADLHIHSCLSPCGSLEMAPDVILERAAEAELDIIALTDHNSGRNLPALEKLAARQKEILCLYGMEVNTSEEVHILALFPGADAVLELEDAVTRTLPALELPPEKGGDQVYVDEHQNILGTVGPYLGNACGLSLSEVVKLTLAGGGLSIPAHINRPAFSLLEQLGFVPDEPFSALELAGHSCARAEQREHLKQLGRRSGLPLVTASDAHYPEDVGRFPCLIELEELNFESLRSAIEAGRTDPFSENRA